MSDRFGFESASLPLVNFVFGRFNIHDHGAMMRQVIWVTASVGVSLLAGMQRAARMIELKEEINNLCAQAALPPRYALDTREGQQ